MSRFLLLSKKRAFWILLFQLLLALCPLLSLLTLATFLLNHEAGLVFGLADVVKASLLTLSPYCISAALLLPLYIEVSSTQSKNSAVGTLYGFDMIGGIIGGFAFTFFLIPEFSPLWISYGLLILGILNLISLARILLTSISFKTLMFATLGLIASLFYLHKPVKNYLSRSILRGQEYISSYSSPYNKVVLQESHGQYSIFVNGQPVLSNEDPLTAEERIHYALSQARDCQRVLLVGSPLLASLGEVFKYNVKDLHYVDIDPLLAKIAIEIFPQIRDPRVRTFTVDARAFIKTQSNAYDAIIMALPDPSNGQLNRFYTIEFFNLIKKSLKANGIFSFSLSGAENYLSEELKELTASLINALKDVFANVMLLPGSTQYLIASDSVLSYEIAPLLSKKGIPTLIINKAFMDAKFGGGRLEESKKLIKGVHRANSDLFPIAYYQNLKLWLKAFDSSFLFISVFFVLLFLFLCLLVAFSKAALVSSAVASSAFVGMGFEILIILAFQILFGAIYQHMGLLISAFLAGGALGSLIWGSLRTTTRAWVALHDVALAILALFIGSIFFFLPMIATKSFAVGLVLFSSLNFFGGFFVGAQFVSAARTSIRVEDISIGQRAASFLALDFIGASLGALLVGVFALPFFGFLGASLLLFVLKLPTAILLGFRECSGKDLSLFFRFLPLTIALGFLGLLGLLILHDETKMSIYAFSFLIEYKLVVVLLLGLELIRAAGLLRYLATKLNAIFKKTSEKLVYLWGGISSTRWVNYFAFSLVVFYPIFRCNFKIPYVFCHVCPRKCIFGHFRPYLVPMALIMNLEKRHWCYHVCPIGTLHDCQFHARKKLKASPRFFSWVATFFLLATIVFYFEAAASARGKMNFTFDSFAWLWVGGFQTNSTVLWVFFGVVVLSFIFHRLFCNLICPIGNISKFLAAFFLKCSKPFNGKQVGSSDTMQKD
ncbi:MAG: fused MFS/spermidine synthase [SAR324 cluster bacterium]|uniref:Fused MFS/spermidine synthase n=1 Tax=SAR324 cluster bacterium TaxID=2024889 RepID=A0A7X9IKH0_9DELT|nr:fused MFS/spermidine synthase [SAR324 cluster bacterium]